MNEHPESLIERREALSSAEAEVLRAHVRRCAACRLELGVHDELRAERAAPLDAASMAAWVERSMEVLAAKAPADVAVIRVLRPPPRRYRILLLAAALIALAAVAAAFVGRPTTRPVTPVAERPSGPPHASAPKEITAVSVTPEDLPSVPPTAPLLVGPSAPKAHPVTRAEPAETAEALFARANRARREGSPSDAVEAYRDLLRTYPDSPEASPSLISLGKMLLDRGDAAGALRHFDAYLERSLATELREEAMMLRATSLGRLGRDTEERRAWESFLGDYPSSLYAPRARTRVAEPR